MGRRWRDFIEGVLPWYNPTAERLRDKRTEAIRRRSITARIRAERVIDEYERAEAASTAHGRRMIDEIRRDEAQ